MKTPRFTHPKKQGEWAELVFMARAAGLGFNVLRPHGDSMPFDVVLECRGRFIRVQVKSVGKMKPSRRSYRVSISRCGAGRVSYSRREIDFIAVLAIPEDAWFIIPVEKVGMRRNIWIPAMSEPLNREFEPYREAWHLIGRPRKKRTRWGRARTKR